MVVTVAEVRMMQVAIDQIVGMAIVGYSVVMASWAMHMGGVVTRANVAIGTFRGVLRIIGEGMRLHPALGQLVMKLTFV